VIGIFIAGTSVLEGSVAPAKVGEHLSAVLPESLKLNYKIWPFVQFINFALVPRAYQILWVNSVSLVWTVLLSMTTHKSQK